MGRRLGFVVAAVALAGGLLLMASLVLFAGMFGADSGDTGNCSDGTLQAAPAPSAGAKSVGDMTPQELANADTVIAVGRRMGVPDRGILIALATASQESAFRNYANDGRGNDLNSFQFGIDRSLSLPHDAVGTDHGSLGIFQQQWPWWGSMRDLMTPATAAQKFYRALDQVRGWQGMALTAAAQRVQSSAYPDAYADDEPLARQLLTGRANAPMVQAASYQDTKQTECARTLASGPIVFPLPHSAQYVDEHNWGGHGGHWASWHTGTDLSTACGTPVLAATAGTVLIHTDQPWAGRWLVQVSTGTGQLTTWYAHMRALNVSAGESVRAGQQIGQVGDLGNATGCHLHFEVHPHGGSIYQDSVNPSSWLADHVGRGSTSTTKPVNWGEGGFTIATFNVLGDSHTARGGNKPWMSSGTTRIRGAVAMLDRYGVDVAGLQEFQRPQYRAFLRDAGDRYAVFSARHDTDNALAWRRDRFDFVSGSFVHIPYFDGHRRSMPVVELRDRLSGATATFLNVHNPADTRRYPHQAHWRALAVAHERALVSRLARSGPVFVTGDMNDRRKVLCRFGAGDLLTSANGAVGGPSCHQPRHAQIDWVFGTRGSSFTHYTVDPAPLRRSFSDHPFVVVRAGSG